MKKTLVNTVLYATLIIASVALFACGAAFGIASRAEATPPPVEAPTAVMATPEPTPIGITKEQWEERVAEILADKDFFHFGREVGFLFQMAYDLGFTVDFSLSEDEYFDNAIISFVHENNGSIRVIERNQKGSVWFDTICDYIPPSIEYTADIDIERKQSLTVVSSYGNKRTLVGSDFEDTSFIETLCYTLVRVSLYGEEGIYEVYPFGE